MMSSSVSKFFVLKDDLHSQADSAICVYVGVESTSSGVGRRRSYIRRASGILWKKSEWAR
jgi:hypothetical protein